ncbi:hypothetical protein RRG08_061589 [Elysia crispata]|uniref:Uncharacterized protein n=1 Tax=Elysia crispata TaxID=231223 RepID=A0AAE0YSK0_9GAST|nr:hypothetical protein RRG08_061589 [Elysia crispata]
MVEEACYISKNRTTPLNFLNFEGFSLTGGGGVGWNAVFLISRRPRFNDRKKPELLSASNFAARSRALLAVLLGRGCMNGYPVLKPGQAKGDNIG